MKFEYSDQFAMSRDELEDHFDTVKQLILRGLVTEGYIESEEADKWAETHTIITKKKNFFRSLVKKENENEIESPTQRYLILVKK